LPGATEQAPPSVECATRGERAAAAIVQHSGFVLWRRFVAGLASVSWNLMD
jgi:hypothetical protein